MSDAPTPEAIRDWQPIETAPKGIAEPMPPPTRGFRVKTVYLLGFCLEPDMEDVVDRTSCISVIWWEPVEQRWYGQGAMPVTPTHWMRLPLPPVAP